MPRDVEQLLSDTASYPMEPIVPGEIVRRAQRRRRRRFAAASGAGALCVLGVAFVLAMTAGIDPVQPEITDRPPIPDLPEPGPETPDPPPDPETPDPMPPDPTPPEEPQENPSAENDGVPTITLAQVGQPLLAYGADGVRRITGDTAEQLWSESVTAAFPEPAGGVIVQSDEAAGEPIGWLQAGADTITPLPLSASVGSEGPAGETSRLLGVVLLDGEGTVLFTRRSGEGEGQREDLYAYGLQSGSERAFGQTGAYESGLEGVGLAGDRLVLSICHLQCQLLTLAAGSSNEVDGAEEVFDGSQPIQGLAARGDLIAYLEMDLVLLAADPDTELTLWLHDLQTGQRRGFALPHPGLELGAASVQVDLSPAADAVLVTFQAADGSPARRTLLADELDAAPRLRWLDADSRVRFDSVATAEQE